MYSNRIWDFVRKIKQRGKIYYAEVENKWINGKCVQKHIRSLGTDPEHPTKIPIEQIHFSYLALRLMQEALTPNDLFEMLEKMGQPIKIDDLERIGINYDFEKKTYSISLFYKKKLGSKIKTDARYAEKNQTQEPHTNEE